MSIEKVESCPVCNGNSFSPFLVCKDYTATGNLFHVEQCASCGLLITNPRPTQQAAGSYYKSSSYISHTSVSSSIIDSIYLTVRQFTINWKYDLIKKYLRENGLLDYGCGTGNFLAHCKKKRVITYGVEPSSEARALAANQSINVSDSIKNLPERKFDVITLWHVLEHVYDLTETLSQLKSKLTENGIIFIAVPNWKSADANHYKEGWAGYDVPRHVWHFSKANITLLAQNAGLTLRQIIPMKLDAYYVSLLSAKNQASGKLSIIGFIRAILIALRSNWKARRDMNYSSLIYLFQK